MGPISALIAIERKIGLLEPKGEGEELLRIDRPNSSDSRGGARRSRLGPGPERSPEEELGRILAIPEPGGESSSPKVREPGFGRV